MRTKKTTLFNKSHILLEKFELNPEDTFFLCGHRYISGDFICSTETENDASCHRSSWNLHVKKKKNPELRFTMEKSDHGFYYSVPIKEQVEAPKRVGYRKTQKWMFHINGVLYILTFLSAVDEVKVNNEVRPWQLCDKTMEDHFVTDLLTELDKITELSKEKKLRWFLLDDLQKNWEFYLTDINDLDKSKVWFVKEASDAKRAIYEVLFGDPDGPKYQTNEEKILAHGFDLKTSFRDVLP